MLLRIEKSHHWRYLTRKRTRLLRDVPVSWWSTGNALSSCSCADDNVISYRDRIWERKGEKLYFDGGGMGQLRKSPHQMLVKALG